jgi:hypothetical protein
VTANRNEAASMPLNSVDERRESFCDRFVEYPWCDLDNRPKLRKAIDTLVERVPEDVLDGLSSILLVAPSPWQLGAAMFAPKMPEDGGALVYLSPELEGDLWAQSESNHTLAHEIAHVYLKHHLPKNMNVQAADVSLPYLQLPHEQEADALVKKWGYEIPTRRTTQRNGPADCTQIRLGRSRTGFEYLLRSEPEQKP